MAVFGRLLLLPGIVGVLLPGADDRSAAAVYDPGMQPMTYRITPRQRRVLRAWTVLVPAALAVFFVFGPAIGAVYVAVGLVASGVYLNMASGKTTVGPGGIRTSRFLRRGAWTWQEIESISVHHEESRRESATARIAVHTVEGRTRCLYAPIDWCRWWPDDTFDAKAAAIIRAGQSQGADLQGR